MKFYYVNKCVRERLKGKIPKNIELVALSNNSSFAELEFELNKRGCKIHFSQPQFQALRCKFPQVGDCNVYLCHKNLEEYLSDKVFTINAMAQDLETNEVTDFFNGQEHLDFNLLNFIGSPTDRINENRLNVFKALRISLQDNLLFSDKQAAPIIGLKINDFGLISTDRIVEELKLMMAANPINAIELLFLKFPNLGKLLINRGIWFTPTTITKPSM